MMTRRMRLLLLMGALVAAVGVGGCKKKPAGEEGSGVVMKPDTKGRVPLSGKDYGGVGKVQQPQTD